MKRAQPLQDQINKLTAKRQAARSAAQQALTDHAHDPSGDKMAKGINGFRAVNALDEEIAALETALETAHELDHADTTAAWKADIAERIAKARKLVDDRVAIATEMDNAIQAHGAAWLRYHDATQEIIAVSRSCVDVPGMPDVHRRDLMAAIVDAAQGDLIAMRRARIDYVGSCTQVAIDSASDLDLRLSDLESRQ